MSVKPPTPSNVIRDKNQIEAKYAITDEDVDACREWLVQSGWPEMVVKGFLRHMDADLVADAWCPHCNKSVKVRYPNYAGFKNVVQLASQYLMQTMADKGAQAPRTVIHMKGPDLSQLSTAQLREIAAGTARLEEVQEAEWEELPAK